MEITAIVREDTVVLTHTNMNSTHNLVVLNAEHLADDLEATLSPSSHIYRASYNLLVKDTGISVETKLGAFTIPWQHILPTMMQLRAHHPLAQTEG